MFAVESLVIGFAIKAFEVATAIGSDAKRNSCLPAAILTFIDILTCSHKHLLTIPLTIFLTVKGMENVTIQ